MKERLERKIRDLIGKKVIISTNLKVGDLYGTLDKEITNKNFKENTMIYYKDEKNILCGVEFKHIVKIEEIGR